MTISGNVQVCVPNDIHLLTPYVLQEQLDWFEDELKFLRRTIRRGHNVIDIGANYGVYALTAARLAGKEGRVWAFEPFPETASWLRRSIDANRLENIRIIEAAVSGHSGHGVMRASMNSEMNRLADPEDQSSGVSVPLVTLDEYMREQAWPRIDFVKIDVEGHEINVIEGAGRFFETQSPLVMCEIFNGDEAEWEPFYRLESLGYEVYRIIPGLDALVPIRLGEPNVGYQLNMFCCKHDRAQKLEQEGRLVLHPASEAPDLEGESWIELLERYPYGRQHTGKWKSQTGTKPAREWESYRRILNAYAHARSADRPLATRYASLQFAYRELTELLDRNSTHARLLSYARVAADIGQRTHAVATLRRIVKMIQSGEFLYEEEPFLPVSPELEHVDPGGNFPNWVLASVLERMESLSYFSSYFWSGDTDFIVRKLAELGFTTPAMERRSRLVQQRQASSSRD